MDTVLTFISNNWMLLAGGALGGLLGLLLSYKTLEKMLRMIGTSTGDIASLPSGEQVEVVGKVSGEINLQSPITKTPCALWQVVVSERRSSGKHSHWVTVYSNTSTAAFDVYDATGRMKVSPGPQTELILRDDVNKASGLFRPLDEQTQAALNEMGVNTQGFLSLNKTMRVQERFIEQGDEIYVLGKTSANFGARAMDSASPLIVSDHSEMQLLGRFSWQVIITVLVGVFVGAMLSFFFTNR
ncbi:MAG: hypothetical protein IPP66_05340 [Anaerolineales bacterium]|nr:hypothetical protein [Anaerolineales bacterium]